MSRDGARNRKGKQEQYPKSLGKNVLKLSSKKHRQALISPPLATIATSRKSKRSPSQQEGSFFLRPPLEIGAMIWAHVLSNDQHALHIYTRSYGGFGHFRCDLEPSDHTSDYLLHEAQQAPSGNQHLTSIGALKPVEALRGKRLTCCIFS